MSKQEHTPSIWISAFDAIRELAHRLLRKAHAVRGTGPYRIHPSGFLGDLYLTAMAEHVLGNARYFIETGTNVGCTLRHVARKFPNVACLSCEPDRAAWKHATENLSTFRNATVFCEDSLRFIERLKTIPAVTEGDSVFWLDAHGYGFDWPLNDEIAFITSSCPRSRILIHDFHVPGQPQFGFDRYRAQTCDIAMISGALDRSKTYTLYYPTYDEQTSDVYPLRGWVLIEFGFTSPVGVPDMLRDHIRTETIDMH